MWIVNVIKVYNMSIVIKVCISSIFFFKQKTAYEMRISDWSSDVCSSDLSASPHASQEKISKREFLDLPHAVYGLGAEQQLSLADRHLAKLGEIGRASCRERVCQYV